MASWMIGVLEAIANGNGCSVDCLAGARQDRPLQERATTQSILCNGLRKSQELPLPIWRKYHDGVEHCAFYSIAAVAHHDEESSRCCIM